MPSLISMCPNRKKQSEWAQNFWQFHSQQHIHNYTWWNWIELNCISSFEAFNLEREKSERERKRCTKKTLSFDSNHKYEREHTMGANAFVDAITHFGVYSLCPRFFSRPVSITVSMPRFYLAVIQRSRICIRKQTRQNFNSHAIFWYNWNSAVILFIVELHASIAYLSVKVLCIQFISPSSAFPLSLSHFSFSQETFHFRHVFHSNVWIETHGNVINTFYVETRHFPWLRSVAIYWRTLSRCRSNINNLKCNRWIKFIEIYNINW